MSYLKIAIIFFFLHLVSIQLATGQSFSELPKILPAYSEHLASENIPSLCVNNIFQDSTGRLWLTTCNYIRDINKIYLFQFDGYDFHIVEKGLEKLQNAEQITFFEMKDNGELFGFADYKYQFKFFIYNVHNHDFKFLTDNDMGLKNSKIIGIKKIKNEQTSIITQNRNQFQLYTLSDKSLELKNSFSIDTSLLDVPQEEFNSQPTSLQYYPVFQRNNEVWLITNTRNYIRWRKQDRSIQIFKNKDFNAIHPGKDYLKLKSAIFPAITSFKKDNKIYLSPQSHVINKRFVQNEETNQFISDPRIPDSWSSLYFTSDKNGNVIFSFRDEHGKYHAVLQDKNGKLFDYSGMLPKKGRIRKIFGKNFKEEVIISNSNGFIISTVKENGIIKNALSGRSIRNILEISKQQFLIKPFKNKEWEILNTAKNSIMPWSAKFCDAIEPTMRPFELFSDGTGNFWASDNGKLVKYDALLDSCISYPVMFGDGIKVLFAHKNHIVITYQSCLYLFDITSQKMMPVVNKEAPFCLPHNERVGYYFQDALLWLASTKGLWKIDLSTQKGGVCGIKQEIIDNRYSAVHQDKKGKLWLGTYNHGLQIYDPSSHTFQRIDQDNGLCNNTVASILEDEEGVKWVATFNGISLVSPDGQILANISEKDGLSDNENNRTAFLKAADNKLLFGTINGLNIINPDLLKDRIFNNEKAKIYLTSLSHFNIQSQKDTLQKINLENIEIINLPAAQKYISLNFALSNYIKSDKNQFAYMLEGISKDWISLGTQHKLSLNNLPPGKYHLLIKGRDANGIWSANQISIPIHVKEFFYKQYWFYLLVAFPFAVFALLWIRRLNMEKLRMALEIERATKEIRNDKKLIEEQTEKLQELDQAKSRFFTNISHEFRTPLTIISGMIEQIKTKPDLWLEKGSQMIKENTLSLLNLVNQILDLRKLESKNLEVNLVQGDIIQYLRYLTASFQAYAENKGLQLHFLSAQASLQMDYDADKILRIVSNLLSNAVKYTLTGGHIYFHVDQKNENEENYLQIQIQDTGAGITGDQLPNIFDRFYQVDDSTSRKGEGTGIGLALVKELVHLAHGEIKVNSKLGVGTTFLIKFPITTNSPIQNIPIDLPENLEVIARTNPQQIDQKEALTQNPMLLIVEDNPDIVQFLVACLENHYQLQFASNGQEGIDQAIEQVPDLIVSDVMMPKKDGFELCQTLKQDQCTSHIPIVLLTAKADLDSKISGLEQGADAYLTKPFEPRELLVRLKKLLELRQNLQERYVHFETHKTGADTEDAFLLKVQKILHNNLDDENFGIVHLCRALAMSRTQVHRKIKALTGKSSSLFIRSIRLQKGRELLQTTDLSISEVAYQVGFKHPSHFSGFYSEEFGEAPSKTRK